MEDSKGQNIDRDTILMALRNVGRKGITELIGWLESTDFFTAPCSSKFHLAVPGGLAKHSLNVYLLLCDKAAKFNLTVWDETLKVCALLHDVCKVYMYVPDDTDASSAQEYRLKKEAGDKAFYEYKKQGLNMAWTSLLIDYHIKGAKGPVPQKIIGYKVNDILPLGHGEKSLSMIQNFIDLTDEEKLAIRWHMGPWDMGYGNSLNEAMKKYPLVALLHTADMEATHILEREEE